MASDLSERMHCLVPFCNQTTARNCDEWICQQHWRPLNRTYRRAYNKAVKYERWDTAKRIWQHLKRKAIEKAGGIG